MYKLIRFLLRVSCALLAILLVVTLSFAVIYKLFPAKHSSYIDKNCSLFGVDRNLVFALIKAESNFNDKAVSRAGAKGLMQLTDETFEYCMKILGEESDSNDIFDPYLNIRAGVWYLSYLTEKYDGNITNAVAAYNAGSSNVDKWLKDASLSSDGTTLSDIPFGETKRHCEKTKRYTGIYKFLYR